VNREEEIEMAKKNEDAQAEVKRARSAADENMRRNSGRDQASYEHAVDVAERRVKR
jgi:hypothetical protein